MVEANQQIGDFTELLQAATAFLQERPMVDKKEFLEEIKKIALLQVMVEEDQVQRILEPFLEN